MYGSAIQPRINRAQITYPFLKTLAVVTLRERQQQFKLAAARRALGICNKFKNPITRKKYRSAVMRRFNQLRAA